MSLEVEVFDVLICGYGENVEEDLRELWTRIAFSVAVGNADDHLRNHGFLLGQKGWRLSPAFDINPQPGATGLSLNINEHENQLDFAIVEEVAPYFRLGAAQAGHILRHVRDVVSSWESLARRRGCGAAEIERMRGAFHYR